MNNITLKPIDQNNFITCFNLELGEGQDKFVSHPIRSLAQAYVTGISVPPLAFTTGIPWWATSW